MAQATAVYVDGASMCDMICQMLMEWAWHHHVYVCYRVHEGWQQPAGRGTTCAEGEDETVLSAGARMHLLRADCLCKTLTDFSASREAGERSAACKRHTAAPEEGESMKEYIGRLDTLARYGRWPGVFAQVLRGGGTIQLGREMEFWERADAKFAKATSTGRPCEKSLFTADSMSLIGLHGIHPDIAAWVMQRITGAAEWLQGTIVRYK